MSTQSAWSAYRANANGGVGERDELIYAAHRQPAETWAFVREKFGPETSDAVLGLLAVEVIEPLKHRAPADVWASVVADAKSKPSLARVLAALERYNAKYAWLQSRLAGKNAPQPQFGETDLPLPNPYDECARHTHTNPEPPPRPVISKYLNRDYAAWEQVHTTVSSAPEIAFNLFLELVQRAQDRNWLAIDLLEPTIAHHESTIGERVLSELAANRRFRDALRSCRLNVSERFLDQLIAAVQTNG